MTAVFLSDGVEKLLVQLSWPERAAVESVRAALEVDPRRGRRLPDAVPGSEMYAVELLPEETQGRGISVVHRFAPDMDGSMIIWLIVGP